MATESKATETKASEATGAEITTAKVTVIKSFRDKNDKKIRYKVGEVLEFDEERANYIVERGLAQYEDPIA